MSRKVYVEQSAVLEALQAAINKQAGKPDALQFVSDILDAPFVPPPAVPHEMTAMEFFPKWFEICNAYLPDDCYHCPLYVRTNSRKFTPPCMHLMMTDSEEAVAIVEKWAKEHPEEVSDER